MVHRWIHKGNLVRPEKPATLSDSARQTYGTGFTLAYDNQCLIQSEWPGAITHFNEVRQIAVENLIEFACHEAEDGVSLGRAK